MSWRESLREASFRGIPFKVSGHTHERGRRIIVHEFPGREDPFVEDLGKKARRFTVHAYLVGDNYNAERDRLLEAAERTGPGELIHPYRGRMQVACESVLLEESATFNGFCTVALAFVEAGATPPPITRGDTVGATKAAAGALIESAEADFVEVLDQGTRSSAAQEAAAGSFERAADELAKIDLRGPQRKVAEWRDKLADLADNALSKLRTPSGFAQEVSDLIASLPAAYGGREDLWRVLAGLGRSEHRRSGPLLSGGTAADLGDRASSDLLARQLTAEASRQAAVLDWQTYDEATAARDELAALIEELSELAADGPYGNLQGLLAGLVDALPPEDRNLPRLSSVTLPVSLPSLVLAYRLYGDTQRESDLARRARARNPAFLPAGVPIPVLLDTP